MNLAMVALGGAIGASLRYLAGAFFLRLLGPAFPWGTLFVNVFGSFLMGVLIVWLAKRNIVGTELRSFLATGLLGGFTTFSAFSLDVATMLERDAYSLAFGYIAASVLISITALFLGLWLARGLL